MKRGAARWVGEMTPAEREAPPVGLTPFIRVMRAGPTPWGAGTGGEADDSERS